MHIISIIRNMNGFRKNILMDITYLLRYKEFLLNKKRQSNNSSTQPNNNSRASFCTLCNDDCICMNSKHKLLLTANAKNSQNSHNAINLKKMECSKYCTENIFVDCICL